MKPVAFLLAVIVGFSTFGCGDLGTGKIGKSIANQVNGEVKTVDKALLIERNGGIMYLESSSVFAGSKVEPFTGRAISKHPNGQLSYEAFYKNGVKDGSESVWAENGQKLTEAPYVNGKIHGTWIVWTEDGRIGMRMVYENGERVDD